MIDLSIFDLNLTGMNLTGNGCARFSLRLLRFKATKARSGIAVTVHLLTPHHSTYPPHRPPLGQLVHQLVGIPDLPHQRRLDRLDPHPADHDGDAFPHRVQRGGCGEELFEGGARATALPLDGGGISQLESVAS